MVFMIFISYGSMAFLNSTRTNENDHGGLVQIIFLSFHGWFAGSFRRYVAVQPFSFIHVQGALFDPGSYIKVKGGQVRSGQQFRVKMEAPKLDIFFKSWLTYFIKV